MSAVEGLDSSAVLAQHKSHFFATGSPGGQARADTDSLLRRFDEAIADALSTATAESNSTFASRQPTGRPGHSLGASSPDRSAQETADTPGAVTPELLLKKFDSAIAEALADVSEPRLSPRGPVSGTESCPEVHQDISSGRDVSEKQEHLVPPQEVEVPARHGEHHGIDASSRHYSDVRNHGRLPAGMSQVALHGASINMQDEDNSRDLPAERPDAGTTSFPTCGRHDDGLDGDGGSTANGAHAPTPLTSDTLPTLHGDEVEDMKHAPNFPGPMPEPAAAPPAESLLQPVSEGAGTAAVAGTHSAHAPHAEGPSASEFCVCV